MSLTAKKDESKALEIIKIIAPWFSLPIGTLILALVPEVRQQIWPALPKGLLLVLLVISLSTILALFPYLVRLRRRAKLNATSVEFWEKTANTREVEMSKQQTAIGTLGNQLADKNEIIRGLETEVAQLTFAHDHETFIRTVRLLEAFRNNLPKRELKQKDINEYNQLVYTAEREVNCELGEFCIGPQLMESRIINVTTSFDAGGRRIGPSPPTERFCPVETFKRKIDGLLTFLRN